MPSLSQPQVRGGSLAAPSPGDASLDTGGKTIGRLRALARLVLAVGLGLALLLAPPRVSGSLLLLGFVFALYFLFSVGGLTFYRQMVGPLWQWASLMGDGAAFLVVLLLAPGQSAAFLLFFVYFALVAGLWRGWWLAGAVSLGASAAYLGLAWQDSLLVGGGDWLHWLTRESWAVMVGLTAAGTLVGTLAQREKRHLLRVSEVEHFAPLLSFDASWPELWERWLRELAGRFGARRTLLAYHDPETDLITLWQFDSEKESEKWQETTRPPRDAHNFLLSGAPFSLLGERLGSSGEASWRLRHGLWDAVSVSREFVLPARFEEEFKPMSLLSVPIQIGEQWRARVFLLDSCEGGFDLRHLDDLQHLVAGLGPLLANVLTVRSLIIQAVNQERDLISRALHDGVAQTLASVEMQLEVFQRQATDEPVAAGEGLKRLHSVVKQEQETFRRFVRTLKPVRVPAEELNRWVLAHCAQFQQETGIAVEVEAGPVDSSLPEGVCREVFLLLREALHNVQKHAQAQHVLVRLRQDEALLRLVVEDDGQGFPFTGSYSQTALEEMGMLPVSIGEHARLLGGELTIESVPKEGATLRVDIPLH